MTSRRLTPVLTCVAILLGSVQANATPQLRWRGSIQTDMRLTLADDFAYERLETQGDVVLSAKLSRHVAAVGNLRIFLTDRADPQDFLGLTDRTRLDPYRLESDALFVEFRDVGTDGFDIRLGRQQLIWGSADRFHVVSNLNALDVEDPMQFGKTIANEMLVLRYRPDFHLGKEDSPWLEEFGLELVLIPFFKPAQLPQSAGLGFTDVGEQERRANTPLLQKLIAQQNALRKADWTFTYSPSVGLPEKNIKNSMFGARMSMRLLGMDLGFSYFNGYDDFPRAELITADVKGTHVDSFITLTYPRMQVVGFDMATSLDFLDGLGLWAEVGLTFHNDLYRIVATGEVLNVNEVEREIDKGMFVKAVVGMDYTPISWLYINVQYLHGFLDEFGAGNLQNYLVAGMDFKLARNSVLIRIFSIINLNDASFVLYPAISLSPWDGGTLSLGAFLFSSIFPGADPAKKFESPAAGKSNLFLQARGSF